MNRYFQIQAAHLVAFFVLTFLGAPAMGQTISAKEISTVQARNVLTDKDLQMLNDFVKGKMAEMLSVENSVDLAKVKRDLNRARYSKSPAAQQVYNQHFAAAIKSNYQRVLSRAANFEDRQLGASIQLSVVILVSETDSVELIDDFLALLKSESQAERYWAAKGLSGPAIFKHLSQESVGSASLDAVLAGLKECLENEADPTVISAIAAAASIAAHSDALAVVNDCVEKRLDSYKSWTVDKELEDLKIFRNILSMVDRDVAEDNADLQAELVRQAVRLYAAAYSRYSLGRQCGKAETSLWLLKKESQQQLETFLIEGERLLRLVASRFDGEIRSAPRFLKAIDASTCSELSRSYVLLLDSESGIINRVFTLYPDEGVDPYPALSDPPVELIQKAQTRQQVQSKAINVNK